METREWQYSNLSCSHVGMPDKTECRAKTTLIFFQAPSFSLPQKVRLRGRLVLCIEVKTID